MSTVLKGCSIAIGTLEKSQTSTLLHSPPHPVSVAAGTEALLLEAQVINQRDGSLPITPFTVIFQLRGDEPWLPTRSFKQANSKYSARWQLGPPITAGEVMR